MSHSKDKCPGVKFSPVELVESPEAAMGMERELRFPLPLDKDLTFSFVGKFA